MKRNDVFLFITTDKGNIVIPFLSLKDLDNYTVSFSGLGELLDKFNKIFDIDIRDMRVKDIYVSYGYLIPKTENFNYLQLPIKYKSDNFNEEDLKSKFIGYLQGNYQRLRFFDIKHMPKIKQYFYNGDNLNDKDIELLVNSYFKDSNYKKRRDVYFGLKYAGIKIKIDSYSEDKITGNDNLFQFDVRDGYFNSLVSYARKGNEEYERVREEIASFGLEELKDKMRHPYYNVVDGSGDANQVLLSDILALEDTTGMRIEDIKKIIYNSIKGKKKR